MIGHRNHYKIYYASITENDNEMIRNNYEKRVKESRVSLPTLVYAGKEAGQAAIVDEIKGFNVLKLSAAIGYMNLLINNRCALVLIDARLPHWRNFVTAPKTSAATRRIPVFVLSDDEGIRAEATLAGADLALSWPEMNRDGLRLIADIARIPDVDTLRRLACQCAEELPDLALAGLGEFNSKNYYKQHDLFEALWVETDGPVRDLYRAILQVGVAYYHIENGNARGALKMLQRSVQWLYILPDVCQGIDVAQLRRDSYAVRADLERRGQGGLDEFDMSSLKPLRLLAPDQPEST